ncbi:MAG: hydrolase [Pirellula sp.]
MTDWQAIRAWLIDHQSEMESDLESLCNRNSGSASLAGLEQTADWLCEYFRPVSSACRRISLPAFETIDDQGQKIVNKTSSALRWDVDSSLGAVAPRLLMTIHYDTVYGPDSPFQRCVRFEKPGANGEAERCMRGPGVIDAKGGIVVMRWALLAAHKYLDLSKLGITVLLTPDEEIGSPATSRLWPEIANEHAFAMLFEPTMADGSMVSHRKGTGTFTILVRGQAAHSGRNFHAGRNALVHASKVAIALDQLNGLQENVTINVGRIRSGDAVNVVPDLAVMRVNVRVNDKADEEWVVAQVQRVVYEFNLPARGFRTELQGGLGSPPKPADASVLRWMKVAESAAERVGQSLRWGLSGGASDGNKLSALGLPNIDTFGPEGDLLHSDQEWIRLSSLSRKAVLTASMIDAISQSIAAQSIAD